MTGEEQPERAKTPKRVWLFGMAFLLVGAFIIWLGSTINDIGGYDQSIFVNAGVAIGLVGPLYVGQRFLSTRIADARDRAADAESAAIANTQALNDTRAELQSLDQRVHDGLERIRTADIELQNRVAEGDRQEDLVALYKRASTAPRSIDRRGLRVPAKPLEWPLRVRAIELAPEGDRLWLVELQFEDDDLNAVGDLVAWPPEEPADDVFVRLASGLRGVGKWPGDNAYRPQAWLAAISSALGRVVEIREGPHADPDVRQIIELIGDWAITREGLDCVKSTAAWAERSELIGTDSHRAYQRLEHQVAVLNLDESDFNAAFDTAQRVHAALDKQDPGRSPWRGGPIARG